MYPPLQGALRTKPRRDELFTSHTEAIHFITIGGDSPISVMYCMIANWVGQRIEEGEVRQSVVHRTKAFSDVLFRPSDLEFLY